MKKLSKTDLHNKIAELINKKPLIHLKEFREENNFLVHQVTKRLIFKIAAENKISVKVYNGGLNKQKICDWDTFENLTDSQFAKNNNMSRQRAHQLRKTYAPHTNSSIISKNQQLTTSGEIDVLILEYIKNNHGNVIITKFLFVNNLSVNSSGVINKERFEKVAKENSIELNFKNSEYDHGNKCIFRNHCNCEIGKLANTILCRHRRNHKKSLPVNFVNYLANEYIEFYKEDDSPRHRDFYQDIDDEIEFHFDELKLETA